MNNLKNTFVFILLLAAATFSKAENQPMPNTLPPGQHMYVIEREMPGLGQLSGGDLKAASKKSCEVLKHLGPQVVWLHSYVTGNKMYCIYLAPDVDVVREHAKEGGFPANAVNEVSTIISPKTAE